MNRRKNNLRRRMLIGLLAMLIPLFAVISIIFLDVMQGERQRAFGNLKTLADATCASMEQIAYQAYSTSDVFAEDDAVREYIDKKYDDDILKKSVIVTVLNRYFSRHNQLTQQEKIDAIYVDFTNEVYDFLDPNQNEDYILEKIEEYGMNDKEKMGQFHWYPLTDNFLVTERYGELRKDTVIIGSRRIYSLLHERYPYLHIFTIPEQKLYDQYALVAEQTGADIYILDQSGDLISSSVEDAVLKRTAPKEIVDMQIKGITDTEVIRFDSGKHHAAVSYSKQTGWTVWAVVSDEKVVAVTYKLYIKILLAFLFCVVASGGALWWEYRQFMIPIARLNESMKEVDKGNLRAYIEPCGEKELLQMIQLYNLMLQSVEQNMNQQVMMERMRKDLEMQVLAAQINPHFLYNTLETIVWKANEAGRPDIGKIASSLGRMYRLAIKGGPFVPLTHELEHLKAYSEIQKNRYGDKVECILRCQNVDPVRCKVLKLIIQPVVENCYMYACDGLGRPLKIRVNIRSRDEKLEIRVVDNGIGMDRETLEKVRRQMISGKRSTAEDKPRRSSGIGLYNIYARIHMYQENGDMQVWSKPNVGTVVSITLPLQEMD